jgi:hypothetical protein
MAGLKFMGKNPGGLATPINVTEQGNLKTDYGNNIIGIDGVSVVLGGGTIESEIMELGGKTYDLILKAHSALYAPGLVVEVQYLAGDDTIIETETVATFEGDSPFTATFVPKYSKLSFLLTNNSISTRTIWMILSNNTIEPLSKLKWLDIEANSLLKIFDAETIAVSSSVTSEYINSAGFPIQLGLHWSSGTNMKMRIDIKYFLDNGVELLEEINLFAKKSGLGDNTQVLEFSPKFNLFKLVVHNDDTVNARNINLTISRIKQLNSAIRKQMILEPALRDTSVSQSIIIPNNAYGVSLYLMIHNYTEEKAATLKMRVRPALEMFGTSSNSSYTVGGWETDALILDNEAVDIGSNIQMHITPEAMYLQEYPYDVGQTNSVLSLKTIPYKLSTDKLLVNIYIESTTFEADEGIEFELIAYWHI